MFNTIFPTRKNPYIPGRNAKEVLTTNFSGTEFSIALPPTSNGFASVTDRHKQYLDIEHPQSFKNDAKHHFEKGLPWQQPFLAREPTLFSGFFRNQRIGHMTIAGSVWYFNDMPSEMTLFNPLHCEQAIRRLNYFYMGPGSLTEKRYIQPLNWQIVEQSQVQWVYHEGTNFDENEWRERYNNEPLPALASYYRCRYAVPVGERQLLSIVFSYTGYQPVETAIKVLHELRKECFSSINLRYSSLVIKKFEDAKAKWPEARYNTNREPEKWIWHDFLDSKDYEIREAGSPAPAWLSDLE